ncbi:MAG: transposase [Patescibacteria group bacterium]|nr:transposase [Patescibacteria group bacterium]
MVPPNFPELPYSLDGERRPEGESAGDICPNCGQTSVILGDDEKFFCQNCGYKESETHG